jgi:uncharacterized protein DUF2846
MNAPKENPMSIRTMFARRLSRAAVMGLLAALLVGGLLSSAGAAVVPGGPPPGYARIWVYRYYEPYESLATPSVRFNGAIIGISEPGGSFYRDVAPGEYDVTVDSLGRDVNQFARVDVAAGQQIYIQVQVSRYWDCGGGGGDRGGGDWCRPTFYTRLQLPDVAASAIAHMPSYGGS